MVKVTSRRTLDFPSLPWSIEKDEVKEVPKEFEEIILSNPFISKEESKKTSNKE